MSLIVDNVEIENIVVIKLSTGESVEIDTLQDNNGVVIFKKQSDEIILHINMTQGIIDSGYGTVQLSFTKQDTTSNIVDWGDVDTVETSTSGAVSFSHSYTSPIETDIKISGQGIIEFLGSSQGALTCQGSGTAVGISDMLEYYKLGSICKGIWNLPYAESTGINIYTKPAYNRNYRVEPYCFNGGSNISKCYYNLNMENFRGTFPITDPIYQSETDADNYLYAFSFRDKRIASIGKTFDKTQLNNYNINGLSFGGVVVGADTENVYPATLKYFYSGCLQTTGSPVVLRLNTPADVQVEMPQAGDGTGVAYFKNAREYTIYTDNPVIKNYNWTADNVTATIYHLDGSAW